MCGGRVLKGGTAGHMVADKLRARRRHPRHQHKADQKDVHGRDKPGRDEVDDPAQRFHPHCGEREARRSNPAPRALLWIASLRSQ
jgi:hypothetical protein